MTDDLLGLLLWVALALFVAASVLPRRFATPVGAVGWVTFGVYCLSLLPHYMAEGSPLYVGAVILALPITVYMAYLMHWRKEDVLVPITRLAAITGVVYMPFDVIPPLRDGLIQLTTDITQAGMLALGVPVERFSWNTLQLNIYKVEIIPACTAIQSIALFAGVVGAVSSSWQNRLKAFAVSIPVIYALNFVRNVFVVSAYGYQWFPWMPEAVAPAGEPYKASFFWAHSVFAELGSVLALILIAFAVIKVMPEVLDVLGRFLDLFRIPQLLGLRRGGGGPGRGAGRRESGGAGRAGPGTMLPKRKKEGGRS